MSGRRAKYLRKMLLENLNIDLRNSNAISRRVYRRLKRRYTSLNKEEKSKYKIEDYV
jgi:hypothetical protein